MLQCVNQYAKNMPAFVKKTKAILKIQDLNYFKVCL